MLTLDLPTAVVTLPDSRIAETRRRIPSLVNRGRNNLLELLETTPVDVQRVGESGRSVYAVMGDSPYTASFARFLNDAAHRWLPDVDDRNGFVFALPYRHAIILQPCSTPAEIRDALELVPDYAQRMHGEGVSPVSMHAYHWLGRQITCLTTEEDDGTMSVQPERGARAGHGPGSTGRLTRPGTIALAGCSAERHEPQEQRPGDGRDDDERVEAVHQAAVPGQQRAHVLDAEVALDGRLDRGRPGSPPPPRRRPSDGSPPTTAAEQQRQRDRARRRHR